VLIGDYETKFNEEGKEVFNTFNCVGDKSMRYLWKISHVGSCIDYRSNCWFF